jgi:hypothetical protein
MRSRGGVRVAAVRPPIRAGVLRDGGSARSATVDEHRPSAPALAALPAPLRGVHPPLRQHGPPAMGARKSDGDGGGGGGGSGDRWAYIDNAGAGGQRVRVLFRSGRSSAESAWELAGRKWG